MSIAPRDAQCSRRSRRCAGQPTFVQRDTTSPGSRHTGPPQLGHVRGHLPRARVRRPQPAHRPDDLGDDVARLAHDDRVAHRARPCGAISSTLCSVARAIVEPATSTGSNTANGVIAPVRPT